MPLVRFIRRPARALLCPYHRNPSTVEADGHYAIELLLKDERRCFPALVPRQRRVHLSGDRVPPKKLTLIKGQGEDQGKDQGAVKTPSFLQNKLEAPIQKPDNSNLSIAKERCLLRLTEVNQSDRIDEVNRTQENFPAKDQSAVETSSPLQNKLETPFQKTDNSNLTTAKECSPLRLTILDLLDWTNEVNTTQENFSAKDLKMAMATTATSTPVTRHVGPHPSFVKVAQPYMLEHQIRELLDNIGVTEAKEDSMRLQGVLYIDNVRKHLMLPVRTFNTAVVCFHKFRLTRADEYNYIDAATATLFFACKVEDTLKRSKEILCAAHNLRLPTAEYLSPDDPTFEVPSKTIIGLERLAIEAVAFDFRSRHPQKYVIKFAKNIGLENEPFGRVAYDMCIDLYRTFAPLKQTAFTMALACLALAAKILDVEVSFLDDKEMFDKSGNTPEELMETVLDLLDLYTHHRGATLVGQNYPIETFIAVRIYFNQKASAQGFSRYYGSNETVQNGHTNGKKEVANGTKSPASPREAQPGVEKGTVRFMLDPQRARDEQKTNDRFFKLEEVEEVEYKR